MDIQIKELDSCKYGVRYEADAGEILNKRGQVLAHFKKAPVPGNRPGKADINAVKMYYKTQIDEALKRALAEDAYHNTIFEKKFRPHGAPRFSTMFMGDGKFVCEFELHTKPNFDLSSYKGFQLPKPHLNTSALEIAEKMLQELRVRFGEVAPYNEEDTVQNGDQVIIDFEGSIEGEKVDIFCGQGESLIIGADQLSGFDIQLLGMKLGETKEFDIIAPESGLPSVAGKTVHFAVTLLMGSRNTPCPLNDELAHKMNKKSFEELREYVQGSASAKFQHMEKMALIEAIANKLVSESNFEIPAWLTISEAQYLTQKAKLNWDSLSSEDKDKYLGVAEKNVRLSLILDKIRELEPETQLTDQDVFSIVKQGLVNTKTNISMDELISQMNNTGYMQILFSRIRDEYTLDYIIRNVEIVE